MKFKFSDEKILSNGEPHRKQTLRPSLISYWTQTLQMGNWHSWQATKTSPLVSTPTCSPQVWQIGISETIILILTSQSVPWIALILQPQIKNDSSRAWIRVCGWFYMENEEPRWTEPMFGRGRWKHWRVVVEKMRGWEVGFRHLQSEEEEMRSKLCVTDGFECLREVEAKIWLGGGRFCTNPFPWESNPANTINPDQELCWWRSPSPN